MDTAEPIVVLHPRCCGIDVHKKEVQACLLVSDGRGSARAEVRAFGPTTEALLDLQETLEGANIKLASVASDVTGTSAREMLELLVAGVSDPALLAQCARGRMREKIPQLEQALSGHFGPHQRFLVAQHLAHIDFLD